MCESVGSQPPKAKPGSLYSWEALSKANLFALSYNGKRMGIYNAKTKEYRIVHAVTGKLSDPVDPPWKTGCATSTSTTTAARQQAPKPASVTKTEGDPPTKQPPWFPYAIGGGVTGAVLLLGLVFRR